MRFTVYLHLITAATVLIIIYTYWTTSNRYRRVIAQVQDTVDDTPPVRKPEMVLAVVACGDRLKETLNVLKSALAFTRNHFTFIVLTEERLMSAFEEKLLEWRALTDQRFAYRVALLNFPVENGNEWRKLFKPCAAQRLFLPTVLSAYDSVLYVDTDTIFLTDIGDIWAHFGRMNSSQMAALAPEHEDRNVGWYNRFARHPYYGEMGVNSGVMLMNLTRMRAFKWSEYVVPIYRKYRSQITWGDQDIINIIFHYHPDKLYLYSCRFNYRPDHCMYMSVCKDAEKFGVGVLHGSRGFFHSEKQPAFTLFYKVFDEFQVGGDVNQQIVLPLHEYLRTAPDGTCTKVARTFVHKLKPLL